MLLLDGTCGDEGAVKVGGVGGAENGHSSISPSELEFQSNTDADPVLEVGEWVSLSTVRNVCDDGGGGGAWLGKSTLALLRMMVVSAMMSWIVYTG